MAMARGLTRSPPLMPRLPQTSSGAPGLPQPTAQRSSASRGTRQRQRMQGNMDVLTLLDYSRPGAFYRGQSVQAKAAAPANRFPGKGKKREETGEASIFKRKTEASPVS